MCVDANRAGEAAGTSNINSAAFGTDPSRHPSNVSRVHALLLDKPATHSARQQRFEQRRGNRGAMASGIEGIPDTDRLLIYVNMTFPGSGSKCNCCSRIRLQWVCSDRWAQGMAHQQCRTRSRPLLPLQDPSSESDSPCFVPERGGPQPAPLPHALARSRSPLSRRQRSPMAQQRSAAAERAARWLADQRAAQESARLAARLVDRVAARNAAWDAARRAARVADRLAASVAREEGYWDGVPLHRRPSVMSGDNCVRSRQRPSDVDVPETPGTAQRRST